MSNQVGKTPASKEAATTPDESVTETEQKKSEKQKKTAVDKASIFSPKKSKQTWNTYGKADPLAGPMTGGMSPGPMSMAANMQLHSRLSINLFRGRKGEPDKNIRPIIGLARFGRQVALVWSAAAEDDPFADQTLINIELAYDTANRLIKDRSEALAALVDGMDGFEVQYQESVEPVSLDLKFYSPWGFRGAVLLREFDVLVRRALTARHLGLFTNDDWQNVVHDSQRALRHMFAEVDSWVNTGVRRQDMDQNNRVAKRAQSVYTELKKGYLVLDSDVMQGFVRAKLAPPNKRLQERLEKFEEETGETVNVRHKPAKAPEVTPVETVETGEVMDGAEGSVEDGRTLQKTSQAN